VSYTIIDVPQRSPEWFAARIGRLGASKAGDMLATIKTGEAAARRDLRTRLVLERITGRPQEDTPINADMQRGINLEADALAAYEAKTGIVVSRVGFLQHDTLMTGCSPDGIIDNIRGGIEIKCPRSATHLRYLRSDGLPAEAKAQILHTLWITGAEFWDFVSYDPLFPDHLQLFVHRVGRNDFDVMAYGRTVETFLAEVDAEVEELLQRLAVSA
jgi:hypothetical protein